MAIYLDIAPSETRATTHRVMAAVESFIGWMLFGPRQHEADLRWSLGTVSSTSYSERAGKP